MQFQVPQFIEMEDKIFGPLTFRQFIYLGGGVGSAYLTWRILPFFIAIPVALALVGFAATLAFFSFNGRPFIVAVENAFFFFIHPHLYLWKNDRSLANVKKAAAGADRTAQYVPKLSESKLHELAWSLDIRERIAGGITEEDRDTVAPVVTARNALVR